MDALVIVSGILCLGALGQAGFLLLHASEHWRFHRHRLERELADVSGKRTTLIVPCKGLDLNLEANLRALFEQRGVDYELCFVVESEGDPAVPVIRRVTERHPERRCRIVSAGIATDCGQKVHSLIAATSAIGAETDVLAFVDSDACPHPEWLARLVGRLQSGRYAAATGYRWFVPARNTWANRMLSAVNNTIIGLTGPHKHMLVWGGAWAISTEMFRNLGLPEAWRGSLSDDLTVSRLIHAAKRRVAYEPHCLVNSHADYTAAGLGEFLRRQFIVGKVYAPRWWLFGLAGATQAIVHLAGLAGLTAWWLVSGGPWAIPAAGLTAYYALSALRILLGAEAVKPFLRVPADVRRGVVRWNVWGWPAVTACVWLGLMSSAIGRTITWRGIRYRLVSPRRTEILERPGLDATPAMNQASRAKAA